MRANMSWAIFESIRRSVAPNPVNRAAPAQHIVDRGHDIAPGSVDERIISALTGIDRPLPFAELRALCRSRSATIYNRLDALVAAGRLAKSPQGYRLAGDCRSNSSK